MKSKKEFYNESEIRKLNQFIRLSVSRFNFYISRQKSFDSQGRYSEIAGILDINIPRTNISGNNVETITIYFRAEGGLRTKPIYSTNKVQIEMPEKDLNFWLNGLQFPRLEIDIQSSEPNEESYFFIYLSAGKP